MSLETEAIIDRRQLRRRLALWRTLAVVVAGLAIFAIVGGKDALTLSLEPQVARIAIEGTITEDRTQLKMLKKIRDDGNVKALLVFVNSPGGTTSGGEALFQALRDVAAVKPVVAQFGTIAASAGYIVGLGTDYIVARGNTITGSIGVLAQWPEVSQLLDKVGVTFNEVKSGPLKAAPNPFEPASPEAKAVMQDTIDDGFRWFLSLVETRRGISPASVKGLTDGRIFSGRQALEAKLVDEIGGETEAVRWLVENKGIPKNIKLVDWKPETETNWGLSSAVSEFVVSTAGRSAEAFGHGLKASTGLLGVGLDGLVSVWHPAEK